MEKANMDIRQYLEDHGVTQKMLGAKLGFKEWKMSTILKEELPESEKEKMLSTIDSIIASMVQPSEETSEPEAQQVPEPVQVTCTTRFQVGDRVKIPSKALRIGIISDIWNSLRTSMLMYAVDMEDGTKGMYAENQIEAAPLPIEYSFKAIIDSNVAVVTMHAEQGEQGWVVARGHAHILHDGEVGIAQAVSFAARRMFESLDTKNQNPESRIYFKEERK